MKINVLTFGVITDITGSSALIINNADSTDCLKEMMEEKYPGLKIIRYAIAVNKQLVQQNTSLDNNATVALLPPFSGG